MGKLVSMRLTAGSCVAAKPYQLSIHRCMHITIITSIYNVLKQSLQLIRYLPITAFTFYKIQFFISQSNTYSRFDSHLTSLAFSHIHTFHHTLINLNLYNVFLLNVILNSEIKFITLAFFQHDKKLYFLKPSILYVPLFNK